MRRAGEVEQRRVGVERAGDLALSTGLASRHDDGGDPVRGGGGEDAPPCLGSHPPGARARDVLRRARGVPPGRTHARRDIGRGGGGGGPRRRSRGRRRPGRGSGTGGQAGLAGVGLGGILVVNADVPCVVPHDLRSLLAATPAGCLALVEALDGTTNALSLPSAGAFAPLYGPSSSDRFRAHGASLGLEVVSVLVPNLVDDVDTMEDLTGCSCAPARARRPVSWSSRGAPSERRRPLGRRGRRALRPRRRRRRGRGRDERDRQRRRRPRGARPPRLADLDSILYALAGLADEQRGWGRATRPGTRSRPSASSAARPGSRSAIATSGSSRADAGASRRRAALRRDRSAGLGARRRAARLLPATDDRLRTWLETPAGTFPFQEWFVARGHRDEVDAVRFEGEEPARPAPGVLEAIAGADLILIAPSNPYVSIGPILAVRELATRSRGGTSLRRRQPADRRPGGQGPGRPDAAAARRRDVAART